MSVENGKELNLGVTRIIAASTSWLFQIQDNRNTIFVVVSYNTICRVGTVCLEELWWQVSRPLAYLCLFKLNIFVELELHRLILCQVMTRAIEALTLTQHCVRVLRLSCTSWLFDRESLVESRILLFKLSMRQLLIVLTTTSESGICLIFVVNCILLLILIDVATSLNLDWL